MKNMKRLLITASLAAALALGSASAVFAAERNSITTTGTGIVKVQPDVATMSFTIQSAGKTAESAQKDNNMISAKVISKLEEMGIAKDKIITSYSAVYPTYQYDAETGKSSINGYQAKINLDATVKDIDNVGSYIDGALKAGATGFNNVIFSLEDTNRYYTQALQQAVKNASNSATAIATAYGKPLGEILNVVEHESYASFEEPALYKERAMSDTGYGSTNQTVIQYDKVQVTATITATYGI
ncbi:SIMPL domain-containing protein [Anaerotignum sp.]|uniref:SIMPL domain-containing protein n=1 Tax=Anaerotignum sp. TaxID=2039241 RepID=UPI00289A223A|nr:SIMPL domain-containing protein [Anaerotignum sp.]